MNAGQRIIMTVGCCGLMLGAFGCASKDVIKKDEPIAVSKPAVATPQKNDATPSAPVVPSAAPSARPQQSVKANATDAAFDKIYFDFDNSDLSKSSRDTLTRSAEILMKDQKSVKVRIEGNCDERGLGILSGCGTALFLKLLSAGKDYSGTFIPYQFFLPAALLASSALVRYLAPDAAGHGTEKVIEAVHQKMGKIQLKVVPVKLVATILTLANGGSAGKEGPCAQIGAGLASAFGGLLRLSDNDRRKLVICGISAGFSTVFGTPIAGALFGIEVLVLGQMMSDVMFPSFVAGIVGYHVATLLGVTYPHYPQLNISHIDGVLFFEMLLLGIWCGIIALFFVKLLHIVSDLIVAHPEPWTQDKSYAASLDCSS